MSDEPTLEELGKTLPGAHDWYPDDEVPDAYAVWACTQTMGEVVKAAEALGLTADPVEVLQNVRYRIRKAGT